MSGSGSESGSGSGKRVAFDLFQQGSAPRTLWQEIATSLNAAAMQGSDIIQLHMGAVIQRARLLVFRSIAPNSTEAEPSYGWGATVILSTRTAPDRFEEVALNHFVGDASDQKSGQQDGTARDQIGAWVHEQAVEHFCQVVAVEGWQTQWFSHDVLRGPRTEPANQRLARRVVASVEARLAELRKREDGGKGVTT